MNSWFGPGREWLECVTAVRYIYICWDYKILPDDIGHSGGCGLIASLLWSKHILKLHEFLQNSL